MLDKQRRVAQAIKRPNLTLNAEREPAGLVFGLAALFLLIGFGLVMPWMFVAGLLILCLIPILQKIAKYDPQFFAIYQRQLRYKAYYPARSTPWCKR